MAVYFLWHFPYSARANGAERWALPTIAPCGVRTFLRRQSRDRADNQVFLAARPNHEFSGDHRARHELSLESYVTRPVGTTRAVDALNMKYRFHRGRPVLRPRPIVRFERVGSLHALP